jgi:hypothetical protein
MRFTAIDLRTNELLNMTEVGNIYEDQSQRQSRLCEVLGIDSTKGEFVKYFDVGYSDLGIWYMRIATNHNDNEVKLGVASKTLDYKRWNLNY